MITVITGPPCAGKTTYVRERAKPGDVVIDFDDIARALGSPEDHDHDPRVREITAAAWSAAIRRLVSEPGTITAWVIDSKPTTDRQDDYRRVRARTVALTAAAPELHRRADADGRSAAWHQRIDAFLATARHRDPAPTVRTRW